MSQKDWRLAYTPLLYDRTVLRKSWPAILLAVMLIGCETTVTTTSIGVTESIPEVTLLAELDSLSNAEAEKLRGALDVRFKRGVYEEAIHPVFWRDDLHKDLVILVPLTNGRVQLLKVDIGGTRIYRVIDGSRNGKAFHEEGLLPSNSE